MRIARLLLAAMLMAWAAVAVAGSLTLPWVGTNSMPNVSELNSNFSATETAVDDNDDRLDGILSDVACTEAGGPCDLEAGTTIGGAAIGGGGGAPTTVDYLVGTADAGLSAEIVFGAAVANQFVTGVSAGAVTRAQPAFSDVSGTATDVQVNGANEEDEIDLLDLQDNATADTCLLNEMVRRNSADTAFECVPLTLDIVLNPAADKAFTMATRTVEWNFTNPAGGMIWNFTGAATGHSLEIKQSGGNPGTSMHLLHIESEDPDPTSLHLVAGATTSRALKVNPLGDTLANPGRFQLFADGDMTWSDGGAAVDVGLIRSAAGTLAVTNGSSGDGIITAATQATTNNTTRVATTAFVQQEIADLEEEAHATEHQHGGADEIATATATANGIVKAGGTGTIDVNWVPTTFATDAEVLAYALPLAGGTLTGNLVLSADANEGVSGGGLSDCDDPTNSKLLWDTSTNKFSCGTDQGGSGSPGGDTTEVQFGLLGVFTGADNLTFASSTAGATFGAGSATAGTKPKLTSGTVLTTAEDGAIEMDDNTVYLTTDAANRGVVPVEHIIRADATRTFTSNTVQQAIFTTPANGRLTLETGTYLFEGIIAMTSMSGTSGNGKFSILGAGGATLGSILWRADGNDVAAEAVAAAAGSSWHIIATQTAANIATAGGATALAFTVEGTFEVTGAGTIVPSFAQTTASAAVVSIGSYIKFNRIGSTTMTNVGQWD